MSSSNSTPENLIEIGTLPLEVVSAVQGMNERYTRLLVELGQLEVRKAELITETQRLQTTTNRILKGESDRLGIPAGQPWSLNPDGKALVPQSIAEKISNSVGGAMDKVKGITPEG